MEKVSTRIEDPFGWIHEEWGDWNLIEDYSDSKRYYRLDCIYNCLVNGIATHNMDGLDKMTEKELKDEYRKKFPLLLAEVFENIAKDIRKGDLEIEIEF